MVNKNNNSSQEVMKNALILYTAFYSNDKEKSRKPARNRTQV